MRNDKRKRHTPEQIVGYLREAAKLLSEGKTLSANDFETPYHAIY